MALSRKLFLIVLFLAAGPISTARAETFATCAQMLNTVPAVISTQGVFCMSADLATSITAGAAITVNTNNVTIDCNGYKLGGLSAGPASTTVGILAVERQNITVRNCSVRGFLIGIDLSGSGHAIEDNRLDLNISGGIRARGDNNTVARNQILTTGPNPNGDTFGIRGAGNIVDNTIGGLTGSTAGELVGIGTAFSVQGFEISRNRVRGVQPAVDGEAFGIIAGPNYRVSRNHVTHTGAVAGYGIYGGSNFFCDGNTVSGFVTKISGCVETGGNLSH